MGTNARVRLIAVIVMLAGLVGSGVMTSVVAASAFRGRALGVDPALVEEYEEDDVVAEAPEAVHGGHGDDEGKQVVDEGVDESGRVCWRGSS